MAKKVIDLSKLPDISAELEVILSNGTKLVVPRMDRELAERVNKIGMDMQAEGRDMHTVLSHQLGALTNVNPSMFEALDMREIMAAVRSILDEILNAGEHLNRSGRRGR